jgi:hypothetical protein
VRNLKADAALAAVLLFLSSAAMSMGREEDFKAEPKTAVETYQAEGVALSLSVPRLMAGQRAEIVLRLTDLASGSSLPGADVSLTVARVGEKPGQARRLRLVPENARWQNGGESAYVARRIFARPGVYIITVTADLTAQGRGGPFTVSVTQEVLAEN